MADIGTSKETQGWNDALAEWTTSQQNTLLRAYSDRVNIALIERWLPDLRGARVLKTDLFDEAVHDGLYPTLAAGGAAVSGIDISERAVAVAKAKYPGLDAQAADVRKLRFPDATFDAVVSNSTLDHFVALDNLAAALGELHRVLKTGGVLLVTLDNAVNPLVALRNALPARVLQRAGLVPYPLGATCGPKRLDAMLRQAGFAPDRASAVMHFPRVLARVLAAVLGSTPWLLKSVAAFEVLDRWPLRYVSGQFVAARAVKRP